MVTRKGQIAPLRQTLYPPLIRALPGVHRHGQVLHQLCLPVLRGDLDQMVGQVRGLQWLEHHRGGRRRPAAGLGRDPPGQGPQDHTRRPEDRGRAARAPSHRHCRVRPRHRRWLGAGIGALGRWRSGHRQVHHHPAGAGQVRPEWRPCRLYLRRRGDGAGAHARRPHGPGRCAPDAGRRHLRRRHSGHPGSRQAPGHCRHRFHPDPVDRRAGRRARHHRPGAHRLLRPGALCQGLRRGAAAGGACDERRPDRGAQGGRASGGCGALFRRRARPSFPRAARHQEPLRRHRRDRRVRDDGQGPGRSRQSVGAVPGRPQIRRPRHRRLRRAGRHAAPAVRDPGAGVALCLRFAPPRRGGLGYRPSGHDPGGAGRPRRGWNRGFRCLSQHRGRPEDRRARGRPGGGCRAGFLFRW